LNDDMITQLSNLSRRNAMHQLVNFVSIRLQEENQRLVDDRANRDYEDRKMPSRSRLADSERMDGRLRHPSHPVDTDTIAFMQYNLERQAEEIKLLKERLYLEANQDPKVVGKSIFPEKDPDSELLRFLTESKKRCSKIEEESKSIEQKVQELRSRRSRSPSPVVINSRQRSLIANSHSVMEGPYVLGIPSTRLGQIHPPHSPPKPLNTNNTIHPAMILRRPLLEWQTIPDLPFPEDPVALPHNNMSTPKTTTFSSRSYEGFAQGDRIMNQSRAVTNTRIPGTIIRESVSSTSVLEKAAGDTTRDKEHNPSPNKDSIRIHQEAHDSFENRKEPEVSEIAKNSNNASPIILQRRTPESEKVEKAIRKGALSFEKYASEDEISQSSSYRKLNTSRRSVVESNKSGYKETADEDQTTFNAPAGQSSNVTSIPQESNKPLLMKRAEEDLDELNLSGPNDISHGSSGGDPDSEFWKL
jgi:hypothetical protein